MPSMLRQQQPQYMYQGVSNNSRSIPVRRNRGLWGGWGGRNRPSPFQRYELTRQGLYKKEIPWWVQEAREHGAPPLQAAPFCSSTHWRTPDTFLETATHVTSSLCCCHWGLVQLRQEEAGDAPSPHVYPNQPARSLTGLTLPMGLTNRTSNTEVAKGRWDEVPRGDTAPAWECICSSCEQTEAP